MPKKITYAYCKTCKHEVEDPSRSPLTMTQKIVWVMIIVGTIGIGAIVYAFYLSGRPKKFCPECDRKLEYSDKPFEKPKKRSDMTPRERVLDKAGIEEETEKKKEQTKKKADEKKKKEKKEEKKVFCSFCGEELIGEEKDFPACPYCKSAL